MMNYYWGPRRRRLQSNSSRSIKVFANYHHQLNNNRKRSQQMNIMTNEDDKQQQKKKQMKILSKCSSSSSRSNLNYAKGKNYDDDLVFYEILIRLPVKTLMRFKSVCKHWGSSIQHDPQLHQLHYNHWEARLPLRSLTVSSFDGYHYRKITGYQVSDAKDLMKGVSYHTFDGMEDLFSVHGLVCMIDFRGQAFHIYNPSTRQGTEWIDVPRYFNYRGSVFGFDPVTKKHKVLCRWTNPAIFEVFTVGENSWRRIDHGYDVPNGNMFHGPCVYLNGAIYWMGKISSCEKGDQKKKRDSGAADVLVAFDVGPEKFRAIPIPDYIISQPGDESYWHEHEYGGRPFTDHLLEVNGRLALLRRKDRNTVTMWMSENDATDHNWSWTEVVFTLPFEWVGKESYVRFNNVRGTDQIIVEYELATTGFAYSLNWKKNTFEKLTSEKLNDSFRCYDGCPSRNTAPVETKCRHFRESLFPVN